MTLDETKAFPLASGASASFFAGSFRQAGESQGYLLVLARNKDDIIAFEAWVPAEVLARERATLEAAAKSIRMRK